MTCVHPVFSVFGHPWEVPAHSSCSQHEHRWPEEDRLRHHCHQGEAELHPVLPSVFNWIAVKVCEHNISVSSQGVGRRYAHVVLRKADIDLNKRAGELTEEEVRRRRRLADSNNVWWGAVLWVYIRLSGPCSSAGFIWMFLSVSMNWATCGF